MFKVLYNLKVKIYRNESESEQIKELTRPPGMVSRAGQLSRQLARAECKGGRRRGAAHRNPQKGKNLNIPTSEPSKR